MEQPLGWVDFYRYRVSLTKPIYEVEKRRKDKKPGYENQRFWARATGGVQLAALMSQWFRVLALSGKSKQCLVGWLACTHVPAFYHTPPTSIRVEWQPHMPKVTLPCWWTAWPRNGGRASPSMSRTGSSAPTTPQVHRRRNSPPPITPRSARVVSPEQSALDPRQITRKESWSVGNVH